MNDYTSNGTDYLSMFLYLNSMFMQQGLGNHILNNLSLKLLTQQDIPQGCKQETCSQETDKSLLKPKRKREKTFICNYDSCGKSFDYKWILERHMNSHFCFKLFKCDYENCDKAYKSKENLNLHIKNKHQNIKPYKCQFCELEFSHRNGKYSFLFVNFNFFMFFIFTFR
jgi:hypothetical protein